MSQPRRSDTRWLTPTFAFTSTSCSAQKVGTAHSRRENSLAVEVPRRHCQELRHEGARHRRYAGPRAHFAFRGLGNVSPQSDKYLEIEFIKMDENPTAPVCLAGGICSFQRRHIRTEQGHRLHQSSTRTPQETRLRAGVFELAEETRRRIRSGVGFSGF